MSEFSKERHIGLDFARFLAICLVLVSHSRQTFSAPNNYLYLTFGGWYGVELFFVLSGFLIGTIFIRETNQKLSSNLIINFWLMRWFRTLPAYYFIVFITWILYDRFHYSYFFFAQGFISNYAIIPVSWSLTVEEWYYFFMPLVFIFVRFFHNEKSFLITIVIIWIFAVVYRCVQFYSHDDQLNTYVASIRISTLRFDNICLGGFLAYINWKFPLLMLNRTLKKSIWYFAVLMFLVVAFVYLKNYLGIKVAFKQDFMVIVYPIITGISCLLIIWALYISPPKFHFAIKPIIYAISLISYSLYLSHLMILRFVNALHISNWEKFLLFIALSVIVAFFLYALIERPFIIIRDRFLKKKINRFN